MSFIPASHEADVNSPYAAHDLEVSTWGMGTLQHSLDGEYHLWGSEFTGSCGVGAWQTNSQTVHWTSSTPTTGPWKRREVVLPAEAHCASTAVSPNGSFIMTLFGGEQRTAKQRIPANYPKGDPINGKFCQNGSTPCGFSKHGCFNTSAPVFGSRPDVDAPSTVAAPKTVAAGSNALPDCAHCATLNCSANCQFPLYVSPGSSGPWKLVFAQMNLATKLNPTNFSGQFSISGPWISANGTTHIVLQTGDWPDFYPPAMRKVNIGTVIRADSWAGPFTVVSRGACGPGEVSIVCLHLLPTSHIR
jgi:hypothetical protein